MMINGKEQEVYLEPEQHRYYHGVTGREYASCSKLRKEYKKPFNTAMISHAVAKSKVKSVGGDVKDYSLIQVEQELICQQWDKKRDDATEIGSKVDGAIDHYFATTEVLFPEMTDLMTNLGEMMAGYKQRISKAVVWSEAHGVAGEIDKLCIRRKGGCADYYDYKTNLHRGMQYQSKYNQFMLNPIDYLEDCNYNDVSLQLSLYALMGEICYNLRPGRLAAILIDTEKGFSYQVIPVPYMKHTAWALLEHFRKIHAGEDNF